MAAAMLYCGFLRRRELRVGTSLSPSGVRFTCTLQSRPPEWGIHIVHTVCLQTLKRSL